MSRKGWIQVGVVSILLVILLVYTQVVYPQIEEARHQEAMRNWPVLVDKKFRAPDDDVVKTFKYCFRVGDNATNYASLLSTAEEETLPIRPDGAAVTIYRWLWHRGDGGEGQGGYLEVRVEDGRIDTCWFNMFVS